MSASPETAWIAAPAEELCLDFANTRYWRGTPAPSEQLHGVTDLVEWCAAKAGLPAARGAAVERWAAAQEAAAASLLAEALGLREATYRLFRAASGKSA